jgi:hypothetical protein
MNGARAMIGNLKAAAHRMVHTFATSELKAARLTVGAGSIVWAYILLFEGPQWHRPAYVYLRELAPQDAWGVAFGFCGVLQFTRAALDVSEARGGWMAVAIATVIAWLWTFVAAALWVSLDPPPAIVAGNVALALASCVILLRTGWQVLRRDR